MRIRPGINAVRLAAVLFGLTFCTFLTIHVLWIVLAGAFAGLWLAFRDLMALRKLVRAVTVTRQLPAVIGRGDAFDVSWTVTSALGSPLVGELRDEVPNEAQPRLLLREFRCPPATVSSSSSQTGRAGSRAVASTTLTQTFTLPIRGAFSFGPLWLRLPGPGRILDGQFPLRQQSSIRVLPETYASPDRFKKELGAEIRLLDKPVFARQHGDGTEFESLKEYRPGDDPRRIDWRATARLQRPIVRRFQIERHRDVMILIDCGRLMGGQTARGSLRTARNSDSPLGTRITGRGTKLDCAVDSALLLARTALQGGDRCGFALFDHSVRGYLPPVSGLPSLPTLVDCVYNARVDWGESDFSQLYATLQRRQSKRSLLVILSDLLDAATSEQFRGSLRQLSRRHVVLFAALRTPLLNQVIHQRVDSLEDASHHAVTYRLLHDRDEALQTLRHAGIHVLDVEPQQLTAPLINEFIAIRQSNRL